jgi:hypothetical protein
MYFGFVCFSFKPGIAPGNELAFNASSGNTFISVFKNSRLLFFSNSKVLPFVLPENLPEAGNAETFYHIAESLVGGILVWGMVSLITGYFLFRLLLRIVTKANYSHPL